MPQKFKSHIIYSYVFCVSNVVGGGARVTVQDDRRASWGKRFSPPTRCILGTELSWLGSTGLFLLSHLVDPSCGCVKDCLNTWASFPQPVKWLSSERMRGVSTWHRACSVGAASAAGRAQDPGSKWA